MDGISVVVGFALLWFTVDVAIDVISTEGIADVLISFCIPCEILSPNTHNSSQNQSKLKPAERPSSLSSFLLSFWQMHYQT